MEKLISLAQVEQLIDEMIEDTYRTIDSGHCTVISSRNSIEELKSKLSSLPTQESGWIALDSLKMKDGERLYIKREGDRYLCNIEGDTGYGFCTLSLGEAISKLSIKPLPKPPLQ